jgi:hypothetical protein
LAERLLDALKLVRRGLFIHAMIKDWKAKKHGLASSGYGKLGSSFPFLANKIKKILKLMNASHVITLRCEFK